MVNILDETFDVRYFVTLVTNACARGEHNCSDLCIPIPGGFHCACTEGRKLVIVNSTQQCVSGVYQYRNVLALSKNPAAISSR